MNMYIKPTNQRLVVLSRLVALLPVLLISCNSQEPSAPKEPALITQEKCSKIEELIDESSEQATAQIEELLGTPPKVSSEDNNKIYLWKDTQSGVKITFPQGSSPLDYHMHCSPDAPPP
jgi:hypothetical protein